MTTWALLVATILPAPTYPPLEDAFRLPPYAVLDSGCDFNRRYRGYLESRIDAEKDREGVLRAALREAEWLGETWALARSVRGVVDGYWGPNRDYGERQLRALIDRVGRDAWREMDFGPCVPLWRFQELKR